MGSWMKIYKQVFPHFKFLHILFLNHNLINKSIFMCLGLPKGMYCNIIDDCATFIEVASDGLSRIVISSNGDEPIFAVCVGCDAGNGTNVATSLSLNNITFFAILIIFTIRSLFL